MAESRLPPLPSAFIHFRSAPSAATRAHSFAGYIPHAYREQEASGSVGGHGGRGGAEDGEARPRSPRATKAAAAALPAAETKEAAMEAAHNDAVKKAWADLDSDRGSDCSSGSTLGTENHGESNGSDTNTSAASSDAEHAATAGHDIVESLEEAGGPPPESHTCGEAEDATGFTTLMIRNLPLNIMQSDVLEELDSSGFRGEYDFLYMPCDFHTGCGKGFAFVNFPRHVTALRFVDAWHKSRRFSMQWSGPTLNISTASCQGCEANRKKWDQPRMRRIKNPNYRPLVLVADAFAGPCSEAKPKSLAGGEATAASPASQAWAARAPAAGRAAEGGGRHRAAPLVAAASPATPATTPWAVAAGRGRRNRKSRAVGA